MSHDSAVKGSELLGGPGVTVSPEQQASAGIRRRARLRWAPWLLVALMLVAALGIRLYRVNDPPLNFHATRQYRSLLIARGYYYDRVNTVPASWRHAAQVARERQGVLEPPVMELLVAAAYRLAGGEWFGIPRLVSSLAWLAGAVMVYLTALRLAPVAGALLATAVYLFLPFAVVASRSFQPDPLMVWLMLAAVWALLRHDERRTTPRWSLAASLAAAAIFVKPVAAFPVLASFAALAAGRGGVRAVVRPGSVAFVLVACAPALAFYGSGMLRWGTLREQARSSWLPALVADPFFWRGWEANVNDVIGWPLVVVALLGVVVSRSGAPGRLLLGLWGGYAAFCLVFSYHVATHDYYHLMLVPVVALSVAPLAPLVAQGLRGADGSTSVVRQVGVAGVVVLALLWSAVETGGRLTARSGLEHQPGIAEEIGTVVAHSTNTVYLSSDYGLSLEYHGHLAGRPWPLVSDLEWERLAGDVPRDAATRFRADFARHRPEYFIVVDQRELERQADLARFLAGEFALLADTGRFRVYDLRR